MLYEATIKLLNKITANELIFIRLLEAEQSLYKSGPVN